MEPLTMLGAIGGAFLKDHLSSTFLLALMIVVMSVVAIKTILTGIYQFNSESANAIVKACNLTDSDELLPTNVYRAHSDASPSMSPYYQLNPTHCAFERSAKLSNGSCRQHAGVVCSKNTSDPLMISSESKLSSVPESHSEPFPSDLLSQPSPCTTHHNTYCNRSIHKIARLNLIRCDVSNHCEEFSFWKRGIVWLSLLLIGTISLNLIAANAPVNYNWIVLLIVVWIVSIFLLVRNDVISLWRRKIR